MKHIVTIALYLVLLTIYNMKIVKKSIKKNNDEVELNVRGTNYETIAFKVSKIAENILSYYADNITGIANKYKNLGNFIDSLDFSSFQGWYRDNLDLAEYLFEHICPLQWLAQETIQEFVEKQNIDVDNELPTDMYGNGKSNLSVANRLLVQALPLKFMVTLLMLTSLQVKRNQTEVKSQANSCCCFSFKKPRPFSYIFEQ